jgi:hypothetical protein
MDCQGYRVKCQHVKNNDVCKNQQYVEFSDEVNRVPIVFQYLSNSNHKE